MGDDADVLAAGGVQFLQCRHHAVEPLLAECSESFIDERVSTLMLFSVRLDRPRANDNEITNPSPPERVFPERTTPSSLSSTRMTSEPGCAVNS